MSLEVLLIPLGLAAIAAIREAQSTDLCERCRPTRITDQSLLRAALAQLGAEKLTESEGRVTGTLGSDTFTFQRVTSVFLGRIDRGSEDRTNTFLADVDRATGRIVQDRSVEDVRARASQLGLTLIQERATDGTVQLVFEQA